MARNNSEDNSFRDLVARLNAMSNLTPDQERSELMEAANKQPKVLDDKDISLADIAKLAGIKEYVEPVKVSKKAQKLVEEITKEPKVESSIAKAIAESDADDSISANINKRSQLCLLLAQKTHYPLSNGSVKILQSSLKSSTRSSFIALNNSRSSPM